MWEGLFHVCYIGDTIVRIALRSTFHFCLIRIIFQFISLFPVGSPIVYDKIDRLSFGIRQGSRKWRYGRRCYAEFGKSWFTAQLFRYGKLNQAGV